METPRKNWAIDYESAALAYALAVTSADLVFVLEVFALTAGGGFESATTNDFFTKAGHLLLMIFLFFGIGWISAFVTAIIPFALGIVLSNRLKISSWPYFVGGATLTAMALSPLLFPEAGLYGAETPFIQRHSGALISFFPCGLVAGVVCWFYLHKRLDAITAPNFNCSRPPSAAAE